MTHPYYTSSILGIVVILLTSPTWAITLGQIDTFESGTLLGWSKGAASDQLAHVATGGNPDGFIRSLSNGTIGPGSRQIVFNQQQWAGDYSSANVDQIKVDFRNDSTAVNQLHMRIGLQNTAAEGTRYVSTTAFQVPNDGQWHTGVFRLSPTDMANVLGTATLDAVLADVGTVRIMSVEGLPAWTGDAIVSSLAIDNVRATLSMDLNDDTGVDAADAGMMFSNWGNSGVGDITNDGVVDAADAGAMFAKWTGDTSPAVHGVPEPSAIVLAIAIAAAARIRRSTLRRSCQ